MKKAYSDQGKSMIGMNDNKMLQGSNFFNLFCKKNFEFKHISLCNNTMLRGNKMLEDEIAKYC